MEGRVEEVESRTNCEKAVELAKLDSLDLLSLRFPLGDRRLCPRGS